MNLQPAQKNWKLLQPDKTLLEEFENALPVSPVLARVLLNRGISSLDEASSFLSPGIGYLHNPSLMDGVDRAVERTLKAVHSGEKIMVHGDYDVDGVTSTALLVRVLRLMKADVSWYIPHREKEGYDISQAAVDEARLRGVSLIITVDCGTSAVEAVEYAGSLGIDVIVTDHHEVGEALSPAYVIVNPKKPGCPYPFKGLAGVGVAFKFAEALVHAAGYHVEAYRRRFCDLFAVGTVADIVPLLGENRVLVKSGLDELPRSGKKGLRALIEVARLSGRTVNSQNLAFVLAPRLNAAGRMGDASVALELLLSRDDAEALELAEKIDAQNRERQSEQERIVEEALSQIEERGLCKKYKVLVIASQGWHPGIIGIVASKITERFSRPAVMVAVDKAGEMGVGSARSIEAFDLFNSISRCGHLLERFGGHAKAAGLSISMENLPEFTSAINRIADETLTEQDLLPQIVVDAELDLDSVTLNLAKELELLEPLGHGNRQPVFMSSGAVVLQKNRIGSAGAHLKLRLGRSGLRAVECVAFGWGNREEAFKLGSCIDLCYNIQANRFGGQETVQMVLRDARPSLTQILDVAPPGNLA